MIKFQFTSLTKRIWFLLSAIIFAIVFVSSLAFTFLFKDFNEDTHRELLQYTHEFVLHTVAENQVNNTIKRFIYHEGMHHFTFDKRTKQIAFLADDKHEEYVDQSLLLWMGSFIKAEPNQTYHGSFKEIRNNQTYLLEISQVKDQLFLISYRGLFEREQFGKVFMIGLLIILCTLPVAKLVAHSIAKPLKQVEAYTRRIANKEWDSELSLQRQDEIGRLASAMNEMKQALKLADEEENKFLQSISHDLKTPVMVIMSYAQAIIDGMYVESAENTARVIKNEAVRLERKIKQILYLNTLDYVLDNEKEQEEVYLDKLLTYLVDNFQAINTDLWWQLNIETKAACIFGNPDRIRVSIENILENQLRFAAKTIQVSLKENESSWMVEIKNDGPLIPESSINQIFKSLYKGENGNFGLGLTISQKIISFYHGSIQVENQSGQVCFTICYPKKWA
ncbi:sensor histidine kinase [Brevibacillus sp. SYSU BS000544]|uniref:sensor histidine kinase n=1 Tax=Brevibacillus sp. SYSU BS000544 TaxID=3416443 RepID=UPI003CE4519A